MTPPMTDSIILRWARTQGMQDMDVYRRAGGYEAARRVAVISR